MATTSLTTAHGHVQIIGEPGNRRWRAFWWDADGKHSRVLGPAWVKPSTRKSPRGATIWRSADGTKPTSAHLTPKEAEAELRRLLEHDAVKRPSVRRSTGLKMTFADAAEAWLLNGERKRNLKLSTRKDYRQALDAYLLPRGVGTAPSDGPEAESPYPRPAFGGLPLSDIRVRHIKEWFEALPHTRTSEKLMTMTGAVLAYAVSEGWIDSNPAAGVKSQPIRYTGDYDFYSREEIDALIESAESGQDAAVYLTAAMTGLRRGELMALRWRDVDFKSHSIHVRTNYSFGQIVPPKSGKVRTVPMVPRVAEALSALSRRDLLSGSDDPVFVSATGRHLDGAVLRRRYAAAVKRAGLRHLPFHSLRHYFGSTAVNRASLVQVQSWMGHSHIQTTARYLHAKSQATDAALLAEAFGTS